MVFVDTSAFHAVLDADDIRHATALLIWNALIGSRRRMVTSNYVVVETCALLQRRLGLPAVRAFRDDILPLFRVLWVSERQHELGMAAVVSANRRKLSLVDCVSFCVMRESGITEAFAFDGHFVEEGFDFPSPTARR